MMLKEILEKVNEQAGLEKAALKAVRGYIKKNSKGGKLVQNFPGYEWSIGGSVEMGDTVVKSMFSDLIDLKSRKDSPAKDGYDEYIGYWGKDGTGIDSISTWKYNNSAKTKVYFEFTDKDKSSKSGRVMKG